MASDSLQKSAEVGPETEASLAVRTWSCRECKQDENLSRWTQYVARRGAGSPERHPAWLAVMAEGLKHNVYCIEASHNGEVAGILPLAYVRSLLFGKFLVSLPYLNQGGVLADDAQVATAMVDRAVALADRLNVRYLELRHEQAVEHPALGATLTSKVHMRMPLPGSRDELWQNFSAKVRNKVRKGEKQGFTVHWGGLDLMAEFYAVFSRNMRDLGTPVFGRSLFQSILSRFGSDAELCVLRDGARPISAGLLVHGRGVTEVPSASSLREYGPTNANDFMYWHLLQRAVDRRQQVFDFGRSTVDGNTYVFKKKWGAEPEPSVWQYYVRRGSARDMRLENGKYNRMVAIWQRLPLGLTRLIGPSIVRGIP